jgi:hypothetical protein
LRLEEHRPEIVYIKGIHNTIADAISRLEYDPSVNQTAKKNFTTKVNKNSISVRDKTGWQSQIQWCKLKVDTNKHEDFNLVFTNHRKEDTLRGQNIPSNYKEIATAQNKDQLFKIYCKNMQKHQKRICYFNLLKTQ